MLAELCTFHIFPFSYKKVRGNCYVLSFSLKLDATPQLVQNIKMINLFFFIVSVVSSKINMLINN